MSTPKLPTFAGNRQPIPDVSPEEHAQGLLRADLSTNLESMNTNAVATHVAAVSKAFIAQSIRPRIPGPPPLNLTDVPAEQREAAVQTYREDMARAERSREERSQNEAIARALHSQGVKLIKAALSRQYPEWNETQVNMIWNEACSQEQNAGLCEIVLTFGHLADFASQLIRAGHTARHSS